MRPIWSCVALGPIPGYRIFSMANTSSSAAIAPAISVGSSAVRRGAAALVAAACSGVLGLAAWLVPSPTGLGTHEAMNLPPCGWVAIADLTCPTCGMTTAFAHAADGNLLGSFLAQPMGCVLALVTAMALLVSVYVAVTGSRLGGSFSRLWNRSTPW